MGPSDDDPFSEDDDLTAESPSTTERHVQPLPGESQDVGAEAWGDQSSVDESSTIRVPSLYFVTTQTTAKSIPTPKHLSSISGVPKNMLKYLDGKTEAFGPFVLFGRLASSGMAEVRLAKEQLADGTTRLCVLKRVHTAYAEFPEYEQMFRTEIRVCNLLNHPNIVRTYSTGEIDGIPYIALEAIDGVTTQELLPFSRKGKLPVSVVIDIGFQVSNALAYAQQLRLADGTPLNLVHRDVSPENILIQRSNGRAKLVDFGIAHYQGRNFKTQTGVVKGKLAYMPPEQLDLKPLDGRTDIFALGVVLTELLTGLPLITNNMLGVVAVEDLSGLIRSRAGKTSAPHSLVELLVSMAAEDRNLRPASSLVVSKELMKIAGGLSEQVSLQTWAKQHLQE